MIPRGIGRVLDEPVPKGLDWDMYCGPAPLAKFNRKRFLSTYRWFWDYSGGYITDYGTHRFDTDAVGRGIFGEGAADRAVVEAVQRVAAARGVPMAQAALAWVLKTPVVTAPIVGPTKPHHLADAAAAGTWPT